MRLVCCHQLSGISGVIVWTQSARPCKRLGRIGNRLAPDLPWQPATTAMLLSLPPSPSPSPSPSLSLSCWLNETRTRFWPKLASKSKSFARWKKSLSGRPQSQRRNFLESDVPAGRLSLKMPVEGQLSICSICSATAHIIRAKGPTDCIWMYLVDLKVKPLQVARPK